MPQIAFKDGLIHFDAAAPSVPGAGAGATMLFVHGVGADHEIWSDWRTVLAPHFATLALDLPGHGGSFRPGAAFDWSFDDLAGMIHAVADVAEAGRLILIGESLGGTACLAAASEPQVAAVITCSTTHIGPTLRHVEEWRAMMDSDGIEGWSADMLAKRFAPGQCDQDKRDWFDKTQRASDGEVILALADLLVGLDLSDRLPIPGFLRQWPAPLTAEGRGEPRRWFGFTTHLGSAPWFRIEARRSAEQRLNASPRPSVALRVELFGTIPLPSITGRRRSRRSSAGECRLIL